MTAPIQFTGLASGIDTKSIIDAIIAADSLPLKQMQNHLAQVQQAQNELNNVKGKPVSVQQNLDSLKLQANVNGKAATPGDPTILTATATPDAATGVLSVNVKQLATGTVVTRT